MVKIAVPIDSNNGWDSPLAYRFARAPFIAIIDISNSGANLQILPNQYAMGRGGVGPAVVQWLASMGVNIVIASSIGPNASAALSGFNIRVLNAPPGTPLRQVLAMHGFSGGF